MTQLTHTLSLPTPPTYSCPHTCLLLVPVQPWDSISMGFIEELPMSNGYNSILVIVNCSLKQAIFIPTHTSFTSEGLADLFVIHVFSKHGVPNHVTSDQGSEFISTFF